VVAGSVKIFTSIDGAAFTSTNLVSTGSDGYEATIPALPCGSSIRFYFSGQITTPAATFIDPADGSHYSLNSAEALVDAASDDFETGGKGWTVENGAGLTAGAWEVATPNVTWNEGVQVSPAAAAGGSSAFVTQNGSAGDNFNATDVDGGATHLISPAIDLTDTNGTVSFDYWFYSSLVGANSTDTLTVSVSNNDGASWTPVATLKGPYLGQPNSFMADENTWKSYSFTVGDFVAPTSTVRVRFSAEDISPASAVEAGIDNFSVDSFECGGGTVCVADITGNNIVDVDDLLLVINNWGAKGGVADITGNGMVDVDDLLAVINAWGNCPL
jgi:hypothetical protein